MNDDLQRAVAIICLTVIVITAEICITITAINTDRDLERPEMYTLVITLCVGLLGGLTLAGMRKRHRWRIEREELNHDNGNNK